MMTMSRVSYVPAFADVAPNSPALSWRHDPGERRRLPQLASALAIFLQEPEQLGQRPTEDGIPSPGVSRYWAKGAEPFPNAVTRAIDESVVASDAPCDLAVIGEAPQFGERMRIHIEELRAHRLKSQPREQKGSASPGS